MGVHVVYTCTCTCQVVSPKVKMLYSLVCLFSLQGHLTPEGAVYATGLGTGLALGAVAVGVMVVAVWFVTRRRS